MLDIHGSLFYAGARALEASLPHATGVHAPVVVLRMRGRVTLGSTAFTVLAGYAQRLGAEGGRLYVSGVDPRLFAAFHHVVDAEVQRRLQVYEALPTLGDSTRRALHDAEAWLVTTDPDAAEVADAAVRPAPMRRAWRWVRDRLPDR